MIVRYLVQFQNLTGAWLDCVLFSNDLALFDDLESADRYADNIEGLVRVITLVGNVP